MMKRLGRIILFGLALLWHACRATQPERFMMQTVINASNAGGRKYVFSPSVQPSISSPSQTSPHWWSLEAIGAMYKHMFPVSCGLMSSSSTPKSTSTSRFVKLCFVVVVFLALGYWLFRCTPSSPEDATAIAAGKSNGTWARTYRESDGTRRESIDLLFRSNIVSLEEFHSENIDRAHIDKLCWVAVNMLTQQSVSDWADSPDQAKKAFELCFKASCTHADSAGVAEQARKQAMELAPEQPIELAPQGVASQEIPHLLMLPTSESLREPAEASIGIANQLPTPVPADDAWPCLSDRTDSDRTHSCLNTPRTHLFEQAAPAPEERLVRTLPLHLLGPTPSIFKYAGRHQEAATSSGLEEVPPLKNLSGRHKEAAAAATSSGLEEEPPLKNLSGDAKLAPAGEAAAEGRAS